jgi:hypothetical protein
MNSTTLTATSLLYTDRGLPSERVLADWRRRRDVARSAHRAIRLPRLPRQPRLRPVRSTS